MKNKKEKKQEEEELTGMAAVWDYLKTFLIIFCVVFAMNKLVYINAVIPSESMQNTIMKGDRVLGNRLAYIKDDPERYDIVIFKYPDDPSKIFIKRVIGLPGETVEIREGRIYIDGASEPLEEDYLKEEWTVNNDGYVFQVPDDSYLVLGDNRNVSLDARYWADEAMEYGVAATESEAEKYSYVSRDAILGKAEFKYWPKVGWIR